jgi:hypothetical protein
VVINRPRLPLGLTPFPVLALYEEDDDAGWAPTVNPGRYLVVASVRTSLSQVLLAPMAAIVWASLQSRSWLRSRSLSEARVVAPPGASEGTGPDSPLAGLAVAVRCTGDGHLHIDLKPAQPRPHARLGTSVVAVMAHASLDHHYGRSGAEDYAHGGRLAAFGGGGVGGGGKCDDACGRGMNGA